jgi:hypothetical protein
MQSFIHRKNVENYRKQLAETKCEAERGQLRKLSTEKEAKEPACPQVARRRPALALVWIADAVTGAGE